MPPKGLVEASLNSRCHRLQVVLGQSPVEPSNLDALLPASLNDLQGWLHSLDTSNVVSVLRMNKVVLHVDNDQNGAIGIEHEAAVVVAIFVAFDNHPPL